MPVTDAERDTYSISVANQINRLNPGQALPDLLWHYTTGESLIRIIESGTLWLTQVACLNDSSEWRYAEQLLREGFEARKKSRPTPPSSDEQWLENQILAPDRSHDRALTAGWLVGCFTMERDDLSQWRGYGGGEDGYAVGFSGRGVFIGGAASKNYLAPVNYDRALHESIARAVADETFKFFLQGLAARPGIDREIWANEFWGAWADITAFLAPIVKDSAFRKENEYRLVRRLEPTDIPNMKFRQRRSMLTRHLPVTLAQPGAKTPLPITEIMVGPSRHQAASRIGVGDLLKAHGYDGMTVTLSRIPFQNT